MPDHRQAPRALVAGVTAVVLAGSAGCTAGDGPDEAASPLPSRSVHSQATLEARPVPTEVTIAKVMGGRLRGPERRRLDEQVTRLVSRYFDAAFLGGRYPRTDFSDAFATFSAGAARRARADRDLLTNAAEGEEVEKVVPRRKQARLHVLRPWGRAVGLTARIRLVFDEERADGSDRRVRVRGRLSMNSHKRGSWKVFAYDVSRTSTALGEGDR